MQSKATTVSAYLASLAPDRRATIEAVRKVIRANLDRDYEEGMQYGMIGYYVPHRVFPAGYHCDPKQPLPFAGLASQKSHVSLYLMGIYCGGDSAGAETPEARWFREAWAKTGKKLDMGKACVRFESAEDVPLEVIGETIRRMPARKYIELYSYSLGQGAQAKAARRTPAGKSASGKAKPATKPGSAKATGKKLSARGKAPSRR
jgi:hypothetical protein